MLITEISENDFRKLNLTVYQKKQIQHDNSRYSLDWVPASINDILDENIQYALDAGYESNERDLSVPVTIAVHLNNSNPTNGGYWDKFMNRFSGEATYYFAFGIKHLYSSRDYYYDKEDYWRVRKKDTAVIYRVHLNPRPFVLKHKTVNSDWPYDFIPDNASPDYKSISLSISYDLQSDGNWKEVSRSCDIQYENSRHIIPVDEHGHKKL